MKIMRLKTYLNMIEKSVGTTMFQNLYALSDAGEEQDLFDGGDISCAIYVSAILMLNKLLNKNLDTPRAVVNKLEQDMKDSGWHEIDEEEVKPGAIVFWAIAPQSEKQVHRHVGFYVGEGMAISNCYSKKVPVKHLWHEHSVGGNRAVESVWFHNDLKN